MEINNVRNEGEHERRSQPGDVCGHQQFDRPPGMHSLFMKGCCWSNCMCVW